MNNQERKKCGKCRVNLLLKEYKERRNGNLTATCIKCLEYRREYMKKWRKENEDIKESVKNYKGPIVITNSSYRLPYREPCPFCNISNCSCGSGY